MRRFGLVMISVVALAGCSQGAPEKEKAAAPVAAGPMTVDEAAHAGPEPFVRALYARYETPDGVGTPPPPGRDPIYSRRMNALIGEDFRNAGDEVPTLNFDPICDCQDGTTVLQQLTITETGVNKAEAALTILKDGMPHQQTLFLVKQGVAWRIEDVVVPGREPLAETLLKAISQRGRRGRRRRRGRSGP